MDNELTWGMITKANRASLSLSEPEFNSVCEGYGTDYCLNCPFAVLIPDTCPMYKACEGTDIRCASCHKVCPCNRTLDYMEVRKEIVKAEIVRVQTLSRRLSECPTEPEDG